MSVDRGGGGGSRCTLLASKGRFCGGRGWLSVKQPGADYRCTLNGPPLGKRLTAIYRQHVLHCYPHPVSALLAGGAPRGGRCERPGWIATHTRTHTHTHTLTTSSEVKSMNPGSIRKSLKHRSRAVTVERCFRRLSQCDQQVKPG